MSSSAYTEKLIELVRKRPPLWDGQQKMMDQPDKLELWKSIGENMYRDWSTLTSAQIYDRVLKIRKRWRSIRDAYMCEIRARKTGKRKSKREYLHFRRLTFLGGMENLPAPVISNNDNDDVYFNHSSDDGDATDDDDPLEHHVIIEKKPKMITRHQEEEIYNDELPEEIHIEVPTKHVVDYDDDSDKQFLMSFAPELKKLPSHIKMWVRAQIASVMQEAVTAHYNNTVPVKDSVTFIQ